MISQNKKIIIISSVLILLPILAGLILWNSLPEQIAVHWNINNVPDGFASKAMAVFVIPIFILALHLLGIFATVFDKRNKNQSKKIVGILFWICPSISWLFGITVYTHAMGKEFNIGIPVTVFLGFLFTVIGNYLPKCTRNHTIGIKLPWTLKDDEVWNKTHRLSGILWVIGGILLAFSSFLPTKIFQIISVFLLFIMVVIPTVYSYIIYRRSRG